MADDKETQQRKVIEPLSFDTLRVIIETGQLHKLCRTAEQNEAYSKHCARVRAEWESLDDFIMHTVFDRPVLADDDDHTQRLSRQRADWQLPVPDDGLVETRFTANLFPYNVDSDIEHNLLWATAPLVDEQLVAMIETNRPSSEGWQNLYWVNPPNLKSIHRIFHAHVLSTR